MAMKIKLPFGKRGDAASVAPTPAKARKPKAPEGGLPLIGQLPSTRQLQILIGALVVLLAIAAVVVVVDARQGTFGTVYIASAGKIRMLSQRLAKAAQLASRGSVEA